MAEAGPGAAGGYVAFISYSHKDAAMGRWLHRKLEGYRLPKRLAGTQGEDGEVPERLTPIFRDRDDLPAAGDLSERVRAALAVSRNLIVLCSPNSAASPWVAKEIAAFRDLHPGRPIFTAIVDGEPGVCFSPALLDGGIEPLAAVLRKEGDGRRLGLLKLVAGLAGVGLDALVQRDAARRVRRVTYVTAAAVTSMLMMALLTAFALNARAEAERQRSEAEGLVEFMLTDLRDRLKGVGRLDVLTAVNRRALDYYQKQDLEGLPESSLERRARILHVMGEDDMKRGEVDRALAHFHEAARSTRTLLAEHPEDPERIITHAQSEFWVGYVDFDRENYAAAKAAFERYKALANKLIALDGGNAEWRKEAAYAEGNLCSIALEPPVDPHGALRSCSAALVNMERAAAALGDGSLNADLANRHGWLADAYKANGNWPRARSERRAQEVILRRMLAARPNDASVREKWILLQISLAEFYGREGNRSVGQQNMKQALSMLDAMIRLDPENTLLVSRRQQLEGELRKLDLNKKKGR
jgi:tetratricopeptide (TPR) repeat protein